MSFRLGAAWNRVYADFLMPSRLPAYRRLLEAILEADYRVVSVERLWRLIENDALDPATRYFVLRHDIDTDPGTAAAMWRIERELGIVGSFYFRLSTLDLRLMRAMADGGAEASYHYEELATIAKQRRVRDRDALIGLVPEAQADFARNLVDLRSKTGLPMRIVASHGDFMNRRLGLPNWVLLVDPAFRADVGIDLETYDEAFMGHVTSRHSDALHPRYWTGESPLDAIARGEPVVYLLVHPRQWRVSRVVSAADDLRRVTDELRYRLPGKPTA